MASLILEGGTFRAIFSAGVIDALLDHNISCPYVIGVSAGICHGISYISKQKGRNLETVLTYRNDKRYIGRRNYLKCKSIFGMDFVFEEVGNHLIPFHREDYFKNITQGMKAIAGITNADTGEIEYVDAVEPEGKYMNLRATCAMPIFFPAIHIGENRYFDGGLSGGIPIKKAIADGNTKHIIVLTRPKGYRKKVGKYDKMGAKFLKLKYPKMSDALLNRYIEYNKTVRYCEDLERQGKAIIIRQIGRASCRERVLRLV